MIDWIACVIKLKHHRINSGHVVSFDSEGEIDWTIPKKKQFEGSYSNKIVLKSQGDITEDGKYASEIYFSGNPSKFLQGHNVFGSDDACGLLVASVLHIVGTGKLIINDLPLCFSSTRNSISNACEMAKPVTFDITHSIKFENRNQVRAYIKQVSLFAHTRSRQATQKGFSLLFNPKSRRWKLKVYSKGDEIENKGRLHKLFPYKKFIQDEADCLCRVEIRFMSLELRKLNINTVKSLTQKLSAQIYADYLASVKMSEKLEVKSDELSSLSRTLRATYLLWKSGVDVMSDMSETNFYLHRKKLLILGVDISIPYVRSSTAEIIPLTRSIEGKPYSIPSEAYDKNLVFKAAPMLRVISN